MRGYELSRLGDMLDSVAEVNLQVHRLDDLKKSPKWLVIAVHSAAQGALTCYLHQGNGLMTWPKKVSDAWLQWYETGNDNPKVKLDYFIPLYAKAKETALASNETSVSCVFTDHHQTQVESLNGFRNRLIHFESGIEFIFQDHLISLVQSGLDTVAALSKSMQFPWHRSDDREHEIATLATHLELIQLRLLVLASDCGQTAAATGDCTGETIF